MRHKRLSILCFALTAMFAFDSNAQTPKTPAQQKSAVVTITDAAGRTHSVKKMRSVTPAERKAAAQRAKQTRAARVQQ